MSPFSLSISYLLLFLSIAFLIGCSEATPPQKIHRGFYYWRSSFQLAQAEKTALQELNVQHLYIKFFDVEWNDVGSQPQPIAPIRFKGKVSSSTLITPVVFITNETLAQADTLQISTLAGNLSKLLSSIATNNQLSLSQEVQLDCDWSGSTKDKYFLLLQKLKQQPFIQGKKLSATIRLHQLKFVNQTGIPPVDKGLLMCYNMGNLRAAKTHNSIIETEELDKYIGSLNNYPLHLDIALPLFDWFVWFQNDHYKGLLYANQLASLQTKEKITFTSDTVINGVMFQEGDWLRYESSDFKVLEEAALYLKRKLPLQERTILLYHLDEKLLSKYKSYELQNLFNRFQ